MFAIAIPGGDTRLSPRYRFHWLNFITFALCFREFNRLPPFSVLLNDYYRHSTFVQRPVFPWRPYAVTQRRDSECNDPDPGRRDLDSIGRERVSSLSRSLASREGKGSGRTRAVLLVLVFARAPIAATVSRITRCNLPVHVLRDRAEIGFPFSGRVSRK